MVGKRGKWPIFQWGYKRFPPRNLGVSWFGNRERGLPLLTKFYGTGKGLSVLFCNVLENRNVDFLFFLLNGLSVCNYFEKLQRGGLAWAKKA